MTQGDVSCVNRDLHVDSILVLNPGSVSGKEHHLSSIVLSVGLKGSLIDGELVGGKLRGSNVKLVMNCGQ